MIDTKKQKIAHEMYKLKKMKEDKIINQKEFKKTKKKVPKDL